MKTTIGLLLLVFTCICSPLFAAKQNVNTVPAEVTIIAHRGSGLTPTSGTELIGNTFNAIQQGVDEGADWIEIDIRQSKDGTLMVFHDATVDRTTDRNGAFDSLTKDELQELKLNVEPTETIPTLEAVFQRFASQGTRFILDIKVRGFRTELLTLVEQYLQNEQVILFGNYSVLKEYIGCPYSLGYTTQYSEGSNRYRFWFGQSFILERCEKLSSDYLVLPRVFIKESLIQKATENELTVWSYGSDDPKAWRQAIDKGATGLIVDDVALAKKELKTPPAD